MRTEKNPISRWISPAAGIVLALYVLWSVGAERQGTPGQKLLLGAVFAALWTFFLYGTGAGAPRHRRRRYLWGLLLYYLWMLLGILFLDAGFGRTGLRGGLNLRPFLTIHNYLRAYELRHIPLRLVVLNLAGNVAVFAPMGVLLPALFRPMRNFFRFAAAMLVGVSAVEVLQLLTGRGSCDIDDLILNMVGALFCWLAVQIPPVRRRLYGATTSKGRR